MKIKSRDKTVTMVIVKKTKKESAVKKMLKNMTSSETSTADIVKEQFPIAAAKGELSINIHQPESIIAPTDEKESLNLETVSDSPKPVEKPVLKTSIRLKSVPLQNKSKRKKNPVFPGHVKILVPHHFKLV